MTRPIDDIQYAFSAGEISPTLLGRSDLEKYDFGLATAVNYFVDYRGGLSTRPGTIFVDYVKNDDRPTKFFPFKFAPALESTYVMLFGHNYIRFIQDGTYVLEGVKNIASISSASPGVVETSGAHDFDTGDWIKLYDIVGPVDLNQQTFQIVITSPTAFQLFDTFGNPVDTSVLAAYVSGGGAYRIYTVETPYDADDLDVLRSYQSRSEITLTHPLYPPMSLVRVSDTNWTLNEATFGNNLAVPTNLTVTSGLASGGTGTPTANAGVGFTVTAVDINGTESLPAQYVFNTAVYNIVVDQRTYLQFKWDAVPGAIYYRIYRTQVVPNGPDITRSQPVGLVGMSYGPEFIDNNIVPNFNETPPLYGNPFANGAIKYVRVTAGGTGYTRTSVVSASIGTGAILQPVVNNAGNLLAIVVIKGGSGYTTSTVFSITNGTGATVTVDLSDEDGNYPAVSSVFQQRRVYAATVSDPLTIFGSRPALYDNFDTSQLIKANDAYTFELDSEEVAPIRHLLASRQGLLAFSQAGIWRLTGPDGVVRATDAVSELQSSNGASLVPPLDIDVDIVYIEGKGQTVRLITYEEYRKIYVGQDLSILSSHLISPAKPIIRWTYAADPYKLIWAVRADGVLLTLTLNKEQNVYAWTQNKTKGLYLDVMSMQENQTDTVYLMTQRKVGERWTKMIERVAVRQFNHVEEAWCVDAGLANIVNTPNAVLTPSAATGNNVPFYSDPGVFTPDDVGSIIRVGFGLAEVTSYVSATEVLCSIIRDITDVIPEDPTLEPIDASPGYWSMDKPTNEVGGLKHLEGELVSILADGAVIPPQVVANGRAVLPPGIFATRIIAGLAYEGFAKILPPNVRDVVIEDKLKRSVTVALRLYESRGLKVGDDPANLLELKEREGERYGEATLTSTGTRIALVDARFDEDGSLYFIQEYPLPATILGYINRMELGDDA